jgi:hypothetical protein
MVAILEDIMNRTLLSALIITTLCALSATAHAIQVVSVNLEGLVEKAGMIFEGTCLSVEHRADDQGLLATYTTFTVHQIWKGQLPQTITIKTYGGSKDPSKQWCRGCPLSSRARQSCCFCILPATRVTQAPWEWGRGNLKSS